MANDDWFEIFLDVYTQLGYPRELVTHWSLPKPDGQRLLEQLIAIQPRNILEIGTFVGFTTLMLAKYSHPDARIHTIDPNFPAQQLELDHKISFHAGGFSTGNTFTSVKSDPYHTVPIVGQNVCETFGTFDLIFIDGLHYTEAVLSDLRLAHRYLQPNGYIIVHDVIGMWGSNVRRAIWQFLTEAPEFVFQHGRYAEMYDAIGVLQLAPKEKKMVPVSRSSPALPSLLDQPEFVTNLASIMIVLCSPGSAVYLGRDRGGLLSRLADFGVKDLLHVGSESFRNSDKMSHSIVVEKFDYHEVYQPSQRFDLCLCVGDGDYLDEKQCRNLIASCVRCSDTIFFGSSPPGEVGVAGPWSRPLSWWVREFWKHGYRFHDAIRPMLEPLKFAHSPQPVYTIATSELTNLYLVRRESLEDSNLSLLLEQVLEEKECRIEDLSLQGVFTDILIQDSLKQRKATQDLLAEREAQLRETQDLLAKRDIQLHIAFGLNPENDSQTREIFDLASRLAPYFERYPRLTHLLSRFLRWHHSTNS
jgi:predicted O-methyltransferase YrrM